MSNASSERSRRTPFSTSLSFSTSIRRFEPCDLQLTREERSSMNLITALDVNATGLTAQRQRVELSSANLANAQTTRTEDGGPYRRKDVVFETKSFEESLGTAMSSAAIKGV